MSNKPLGIHTEGDAFEIHRRVLGQSRKSHDLNVSRQLTIQNHLYYAYLTEDLLPADNPETGYTSAQCRVLRYIQPVSPSSLDMEESTEDSGLDTVTNRFTSFSASAGDLLLIIRNGSEWSPVNVASSGTIRHARLAQCLGNGYYTANLSVNPRFVIPSFSETGTGTISGVGTGSGLTNECDLCSLLYGGNEPVGTAIDYGDAVCSTLVQPTRTSVDGDGALIYVYDPRKLTLEANAHIVITDLGDTADDPAWSPEVGTGTGTAVPQVKVWMILSGNYELIGIPDRFYECCTVNNVQTVKMVRCDTYIVEGVYCQGNQTYCPVGTGTP